MFVIVRKTLNKQITKLLILGSSGTNYLTNRLKFVLNLVLSALFLSINHHGITAQNKGIKISVREFHGVVELKQIKKADNNTKFNTNLTVQVAYIRLIIKEVPTFLSFETANSTHYLQLKLLSGKNARAWDSMDFT